MIKKLLPILLALIGIGGGVGAGLAFKTNPTEMSQAEPCPSKDHGEEMSTDGHAAEGDAPSEQEYVKLNNQFIIPVISKEMVNALVVLSLSVEVEPGLVETVYAREPKLRDAFLQVLFDHANIGGFDGDFTNANNMDVLRLSLAEAARGIIGKSISGVLITEIARQDV